MFNSVRLVLDRILRDTMQKHAGYAPSHPGCIDAAEIRRMILESGHGDSLSFYDGKRIMVKTDTPIGPVTVSMTEAFDDDGCLYLWGFGDRFLVENEFQAALSLIAAIESEKILRLEKEKLLMERNVQKIVVTEAVRSALSERGLHFRLSCIPDDGIVSLSMYREGGCVVNMDVSLDPDMFESEIRRVKDAADTIHDCHVPGIWCTGYLPTLYHNAEVLSQR